jgi:hypothetical protein
MKKIILTLSVLFLTASVSLAQDGEKKQEPKKDKKEEKLKEEKPGGTRMAINEKGLQGTGTKKKNTNSGSTEKKEEPKK